MKKICLLAYVLMAYPTTVGYSWYNITNVSIIGGGDVGQLLKCKPKGLDSTYGAAQCWNWWYMCVF